MTGLRAMFAPRGIAVIGASRQPDKLGAVMAASLRGFPGPLAMVNPRDPEWYPSVGAAAAAQPVDLAVVCVPAERCAAAVAEAAEAGVGAALVCAGGFAEAGSGGEVHQKELAAVVAGTGIRLLGPNTSGFFAPAAHLDATFVAEAARVPAGHVAVVASSGGINHALAFLLAEAGNGISLGVGIGAGVDVTAADVLDHLATDPQTAAVGLHVETVPDGRRLVAAVARVAEVKPVVALAVGRDGADFAADFARSHTGALATTWRTTRAALRQAGAVLVDDEQEMVHALTALSRVRLPRRRDPGVGVVTAQAGPGLLLVDGLHRDGVRVPALTPPAASRVAELLPPLTYRRNPVDTGRPGPSFQGVLGAVAADPDIDLIAVYALAEAAALDLPAALTCAALPVPALVASGGLADTLAPTRQALHDAGIPLLPGPSALATAVRAVVADARARPLAEPGPDVGPVLPVGTDEAAAKDWLDRLGIATPQRRVCSDAAAAQAALAELDGPVAVKLLDAAVRHKTDVGGVVLDVRTPDELDAALRRLPGATYLVERMAPDGIDLVVGARRDPVFGPVVLVGIGGTVAEAWSDVAVRLAPLDAQAAGQMVDELAGRALLDGWRGAPALDRPELGRLMAMLGSALAAAPSLDEVEINPLRATADGLLALDAVVVTQEVADAHTDR